MPCWIWIWHSMLFLLLYTTCCCGILHTPTKKRLRSNDFFFISRDIEAIASCVFLGNFLIEFNSYFSITSDLFYSYLLAFFMLKLRFVIKCVPLEYHFSFWALWKKIYYWFVRDLFARVVPPFFLIFSWRILNIQVLWSSGGFGWFLY